MRQIERRQFAPIVEYGTRKGLKKRMNGLFISNENATVTCQYDVHTYSATSFSSTVPDHLLCCFSFLLFEFDSGAARRGLKTRAPCCHLHTAPR